MTTQIQKQLAEAYQNLPAHWLSLSEEEIDEMGGRLDGRMLNVKPPLPYFSPRDIESELSRLSRPSFKGLPHE